MSRKRATKSHEEAKPITITIKAKTENQQALLDAIDKNIITFCVGVAGTGKTFCAIGKAVEYFLKGYIKKIIVTRPLVDAGEDMGYLPGSFEQKLNPYLAPIFDEMNNFIDVDKNIKEMKFNNLFEIVPFAFMRGRTFKDAFIVVDEAQNATMEQMKMLLTRLGESSKMVISGDLDQSDLRAKEQGSLLHCVTRLAGVDDIDIVYLTQADIVRHPLVGKILERW